MLYILEVLTVTTTGLLAGALLAEACVLVPYWKKMPIADFLSLHHTMASSLYRFYAPLTISGTLFPITMGIVSLTTPESGIFWLASGFCAVLLLLFYILFFKGANESFATDNDQANAHKTLQKWASLHTARTVVAIAGFVSAVIATMY